MTGLPLLIEGYELIKTCSACPEQYDVFAPGNRQVAYFRLRHGRFTAEVPDCGGTLVYDTNPKGDGVFLDHERFAILKTAITEVQKYIANYGEEDDE